MNSIITFESHELEIIDRDGGRWLTASDLAKALDYKSARSVTTVYSRNKDEFTGKMTEVIRLMTSGNLETDTRIFSLRGAHLLAMLARTEQAKKFRRFILDLLESEQAAQYVAARTPAQELADAARVLEQKAQDLTNPQGLGAECHKGQILPSTSPTRARDQQYLIEYLSRQVCHLIDEEQKYRERAEYLETILEHVVDREKLKQARRCNKPN